MEKVNNRNSISMLFFKNSAELNKDNVAKPSTEIACCGIGHVKQQLT